MILRAKFHVVSSLLSVLKIAINDAIIVMPHSLPFTRQFENENMVKLKSGVSILIMLLNESLPQVD